MPTITINGPVGCGAVEIGQMVSQRLDINYVDRLVFAEAAKIVGSPVGSLIEKEQKITRFRDRLANLLQAMLEHEVAGNVDFGFGIETLPAETYTELAGDPSIRSQKVNDKAFIEATTAVVRDLAQANNVVIIGRGANMILADTPGVIHVGMLAPHEVRVETIMQREHLPREKAHDYAHDLEKARVAFFRKFFNAQPNNPELYHLVLNLGEMRQETAAEIIAHAAGDLRHSTEQADALAAQA